MATIIPELSEAQLDKLQSKAEAKVYKSFRDNLSSSYTVLFQIGWILKNERDRAKDGECDFIVCHPKLGYLCVEVKGGGISYKAESDSWYSIDRHQNKFSIKDPIQQAIKAKYSIFSKLKEHPLWRSYSLNNVLRGHAIYFPDIGDPKPLSRPDMPATLIGTKAALNNPQEWIDNAFYFWGSTSTNFNPIEQSGIDFLKKVFARSFSVPPLISVQLDELEKRRIQLTNQQISILDLLQSHRRVAIRGGAGTGKTVLAMEKARRLATDGFKTLLTCYNRQLADHLTLLARDIPNLDVMSFHQLCYQWVDRTDRKTGRDLKSEAKVTFPGTGFFEVQLPMALSFALDVTDERYDAIICDEGQDFGEEYWIPLELLLTDSEESPFYVFYDENQNIYSRAGTFPIQTPPITLTKNCRNTVSIHNAAYGHYHGVSIDPPETDGDELIFETAPNLTSQARKIHSRIVDLIHQNNVSAQDITVLIGDAQNKSGYYAVLKNLPLPGAARWLEEGRRSENDVLLETVNRFKGLESQIIFLWGLDGLDLRANEELLYVGLSRAKSLLIICGTPAAIELLK
jgi:hypothetical protein